MFIFGKLAVRSDKLHTHTFIFNDAKRLQVFYDHFKKKLVLVFLLQHSHWTLRKHCHLGLCFSPTGFLLWWSGRGGDGDDGSVGDGGVGCCGHEVEIVGRRNDGRCSGGTTKQRANSLLPAGRCDRCANFFVS